jgi:dTDP-3,4-didehydro-2,6-dideoxy-alpha-D-glucose 3-reductase
MSPAPASPVRVGILGCSDIARRKFIPALLKARGGVLAAIAGRDRDKAAQMAPAGSWRILDYDGLVVAPDIDLIYLSIPNHLHEEWSIRALEQGKHVICEKPLALSPAAAERMLGTAEREGLLLYENLMFLHHPQHATIRELIGGGLIGRIRTLRSVFGFPLPRAGDFRLDPARGGGAFHDLARYPLGTALHYLQGESYAFRGVSLHREGLTTAVEGVAVTSAEETFSYSIAFGRQYESYYEIIGDKGKIRLERAYTTPADLANHLFITCGSEDASVDVEAQDQFLFMIDHVCGLIRNKGDFPAVHDRSRRIARLADAMWKGCQHENL